MAAALCRPSGTTTMPKLPPPGPCGLCGAQHCGDGSATPTGGPLPFALSTFIEMLAPAGPVLLTELVGAVTQTAELIPLGGPQSPVQANSAGFHRAPTGGLYRPRGGTPNRHGLPLGLLGLFHPSERDQRDRGYCPNPGWWTPRHGLPPPCCSCTRYSTCSRLPAGRIGGCSCLDAGRRCVTCLCLNRWPLLPTSSLAGSPLFSASRRGSGSFSPTSWRPPPRHRAYRRDCCCYCPDGERRATG